MEEPNNGKRKENKAETNTEKDLRGTGESTLHHASSLEQGGDETAEVGGVKRRYMPDGYPDCGPMPELGIHHWCYTMVTVIKNNLEGKEYTV